MYCGEVLDDHNATHNLMNIQPKYLVSVRIVEPFSLLAHAQSRESPPHDGAESTKPLVVRK